MREKLEPEVQPTVNCPICGAEDPEKIIKYPGGEVLGCDECLCVYEAWEYFYPDG